MFEYVPGDASRQRHQYPELMDLRWPSMGGTLVDGNGDLATTLSPLEEMGSMVMTRMKGALDAWKLYPGIGADLDSFRGSPVGINQDTERPGTRPRRAGRARANRAPACGQPAFPGTCRFRSWFR